MHPEAEEWVQIRQAGTTASFSLYQSPKRSASFQILSLKLFWLVAMEEPDMYSTAISKGSNSISTHIATMDLYTLNPQP